jgi:ribonuclease HI
MNKSSKHKKNPREMEENTSSHYAKKVKTHKQQKANNAIDRALKRKDLRDIYTLDEIYN